MHILFITLSFPTPENPMNAIFILEHARAVSKLHNVSVLHVVGQDPRLNQAYSIERQVDNQSLIVHHLKYRRLPIPKSGWISLVYGTLAVFDRAASEFGVPDVVHANLYETAFLGFLIKRLQHIPVVLTEHSSAYPRRLFKPGHLEFARFCMNRLDMLLPVSRDLENHMRRAGVKGSFEVIPNVVDTTLFHPRKESYSPQMPRLPLGIIVAGLVPVKQIDLLIKVIAATNQSGYPVHLRVIGGGGERLNLERLAKFLGINELVHFEGYMPKPQIAEQLRQADFFVLSSRWENLPVALLEALATGLPVLAPAVGGIPEIFNKSNAPIIGRMFTTGDAGDFQTQMIKLIENLASYDPQKISQYAQNEFGILSVANRLDNIYQTLKVKNQ